MLSDLESVAAVALAAEAQGVRHNQQEGGRQMRFRGAALPLTLATIVGCSSPTAPPVEERPPLPNPEAIREFVRMSSLPDKQVVAITRVTPDGDVWFFSLKFGPPVDCLAGCGYARAQGLANGEKIGWFRIESELTDESATPLYDMDQHDENLCSPEFWSSLERCDGDFFHYAFLRRLARSELIGSEPLAAAIATLPTFFDGGLAQVLLSNAAVRGDCGLLRALAALPPHPDYVPVAQEAQALLVNCGA
jgi:hypothetical protein